ncbi:hypothetical protein JCM8547_004779 [Rhodosporidiobolus lusitaniae]
MPSSASSSSSPSLPLPPAPPLSQQPQATPFYTALLAGALAGTSVDTLFFPIDTLKTRLQSQQGFVAAGGFKGVYRGLGSAVVGSAPGASFFFTTYETLKSFLPRAVPKLGEEGMQPVVHMLSASGGEVAACLVRVPTEVVKQRSQTSAAGTSSLDVFKSVLSQQGLRGFYRGFGTTVAREIPFSLLQFPLYERLKLLLAQYHRLPSATRLTNPSSADLSALEAAACGSFAGGVAAAATTPLDVCKTRIMLAGSQGAGAGVAGTAPAPTSLPATFRHILSTEGPRALFKGIVPRVLWISGGGAVFLGVYEKGKKVLSPVAMEGEVKGE